MSKDTAYRKNRWIPALLVIAVVVIVSGIIIYFYRDAPGELPVISTSTDTGDIVISWQDSEGIHAQRLTPAGTLLWGDNGILACSGQDKHYKLTADGLDGVFITWYESSVDRYTANPLYAQRISSNGDLLWGDGIQIGEGLGNPDIVPDGSGGAVFVWNRYRPFSRGLHDDILTVKKYDAGGNPLWGNDGIVVIESTSYHELTEDEIAAGTRGIYARSWPTYSGYYSAVSDGSGGVILAWGIAITPQADAVYAQRYASNGEPVWQDSVMVSGNTLYFAETDVNDGAIIATTSDIVRLGTDGTIIESHLKGSGGVFLPDGDGGFFKIGIGQYPPGNPVNAKYTCTMQRQDSVGNDLWPEIIVVQTETGIYFRDLSYAADGTGGIILTWRLVKNSAPFGPGMTQRLDRNGEPRWGEGGMPVFDDPDFRFQAIADVFSDGEGGAVIIAVTGKGALSGDMIYAQKLDADGNRLWPRGVRVK